MTSAWVTRVSTISAAAPAADGRNGTWVVASVRQSSSMAWSAWQSRAADWSMMPVGAPTNSFSARLAIFASSSRATATPDSEQSASATEHSSAAEDDTPAPTGRSESMSMEAPRMSSPAARSAQAAPAG